MSPTAQRTGRRRKSNAIMTRQKVAGRAYKPDISANVKEGAEKQMPWQGKKL